MTMVAVNLDTTKEVAKLELLVNKPAFGDIY
jgi:hypothetical protein